MSAEKAEEAGVELNHVDAVGDTSIAKWVRSVAIILQKSIIEFLILFLYRNKKDEKPKVKPSQLLNLVSTINKNNYA